MEHWPEAKIVSIVRHPLGVVPAGIVALFDEHSMHVGGQLAGIPILRPQRARELGVQAVIPVTMVHQAKLVERWNLLTGGEIPIRPLLQAQCAAAPTL